jgi:hypothetical protein
MCGVEIDDADRPVAVEHHVVRPEIAVADHLDRVHDRKHPALPRRTCTDHGPVGRRTVLPIRTT